MKCKYIVVYFLFCFITLGFSLLWFFFVPENYDSSMDHIEKRILHDKPALNIHTALEFPELYDAYYNDHLPFRNCLMNIYANIQYSLFKTSISDDVIVGKDGWLFYSKKEDGNSLLSYKGIDLYAEDEMSLIAQNLINYKEALKKYNTQFVVLFAPNKESIYAEYMPDNIKVVTNNNRLDALVTYLREKTDLEIVYPKQEMLELKKKYKLYYSGDTHWNKLGAYVASKQTLAMLGVNLPNIDDLNMNIEMYNQGDLINMSRLVGVVLDDYDYSFRVSTNDYRTVEQDLDNYIYNVSNCNNGKKIMMQRDSFATSMIDYISPLFEKSIFIHWKAFDFEFVVKEKPDYFVLEIVERSIPLLRDFTIKNYNDF